MSSHWSEWPLSKSLQIIETFLVVQWLRLHAANAWSADLIPDQGTKIPHAVWHGQKDLKKKNCLQIINAGEVVEQRTFLHGWWEYKLVQPL